MKKWSSKWKSSKNPSKQRKYVRNAPLHIKSKQLRSPLSKDLRKKYEKKTLRVIRNDKVKITRGQFKGKSGKIDRVDVKKSKVYVVGIEFTKKDGSKASYPIHTSNLQITELNLHDKKRLAKKEETAKKETTKLEKKPAKETKKKAEAKE